MSAAAPPDVSVIVPCRAHAASLTRLCEALARQTLPSARFEVLVVDDGSDPPLALASSFGLALRVLRQGALGPAAARNLALDEARGRVAVLLNADAVPAPELLAGHLAAHPPGASSRLVMGAFDWLPEHATSLVRALDQVGVLMPHANLKAGPLHFGDFCSGNASLPLASLRVLGGFHAGFRRPLWEDLELAWRALRSGLALAYDPSLACGHDHAVTFATWLRRAEWFGFEWVRFARLHGGAAYPVLGGHDEPDETLAGTLLTALLAQHDEDGFRQVELERRLADPSADAAVVSELVVGVNTLARMRGILGALSGASPDDLAERKAELRTKRALVHTVVRSDELRQTERLLEQLPPRTVLVQAERTWVDPRHVPTDPRLVRVRLRAGDTSFGPVLGATDARALCFVEADVVPSAAEFAALFRFLEVSPRVGATGLGERQGLRATSARLTRTLPTGAIAVPRAVLELDATAPASAAATAGSFLERLAARGRALALVVPAGG